MDGRIRIMNGAVFEEQLPRRQIIGAINLSIMSHNDIAVELLKLSHLVVCKQFYVRH